MLDLAHIERTNRWEILIVDPAERPAHLVAPLSNTTGTVVLWEDLDRILDYKDPWGGWAKRKLLDQAEAIAEHLGMVFHRFLAGEVRGHKLRILVNGAPVDPWDPFCLTETATSPLPEHDFRVASETGMGIVHVRPYVLPGQGRFLRPGSVATRIWTVEVEPATGSVRVPRESADPVGRLEPHPYDRRTHQIGPCCS